MSQEVLLVEKEGHIAKLTLNRESRRNALNPELLKALREAFEDLKADDTIRIVCLTGAGEQAFCAGADLLSSMSASSGNPLDSSKEFAYMLQDVRSFPKPIVARVNGHCLGGGFGLALACDIVIAREGAKFGTPEVNVGLFPMMIAPLILEQMPKKQAMEMILTGGKIQAQQALEWNLINNVVPAQELDQAVDDCLQKLSAAAPLAQQQGKQALHETAHMPFDEAVESLSEHLFSLMQTEDALEGISAFMQKRTPQWNGR